jgi:hypothetical protein
MKIMKKSSVEVSFSPKGLTTTFRNITLADFVEKIEENQFSFEVSPRHESVGGGWNLKLYEGKEEMGGGVFEAGDEGYAAAYAEGFDWQYQRL